jgi:DnaJ-class molecular chaperone
MTKFCDACAGSGIKMGLPVTNDSIAAFGPVWCYTVACEKCNGKGSYNDEAKISVPIKYVKDSYWTDR